MPMRQVIRGLHHVGISVPNLDVARAFYVGLLGLKEVKYGRWSKGDQRMDAILGLVNSAGEKLLLESPNLRLEFWRFEHPPAATQSPDRPVCDHGITHLCLEVQDLLALHAVLVAAGVKFLSEPSVGPTGSVAVYGRDPFGNAIEFFQASSNSGDGAPGHR